MNEFDDFAFLLPHFLNIVEKAKDITPGPNNDWMMDADRIALKYGVNLLSIADLLEHTKPRVSGFNNINFIDYHSIFAIARSAVESYLVFYYIFVDHSVKVEERKYRHTLWTLSSLSNRQRVSVFSQAMADALKNEQNQIQKLQQEIKNSPFFNSQSISKKTKKKIEKGKLPIDWKPDGGWSRLAKIADINAQFFNDAYNNLYSAIAHSDRVIVNYIDNINHEEVQQKQKKQKELTEVGLSFLNVITACFIYDYASLFEPSKKYYESHNDLRKKIEDLRYIKSNEYENTYLK